MQKNGGCHKKIAMTSLRENEKGLRNENYGKCSFKKKQHGPVRASFSEGKRENNISVIPNVLRPLYKKCPMEMNS
jgi:hypothetical protein